MVWSPPGSSAHGNLQARILEWVAIAFSRGPSGTQGWNLGSKIIVDGDCSHDIKRLLLLGRKAMTNPDSVLKSRDITLPTKVRSVRATVFPVVTYRCESGTIKKG